MPWSNQGGGWQGGGNRGPWSQGPTGGGGGQPPDLEELLKRGQDRFRRALPSKLGGGGLAFIALILLLVWGASGIYLVDADERGVETRFGTFSQLTTEGFNYHWPYPFESVTIVQADFVNELNIGFRKTASGRTEVVRDVPEESLMLTGDENIVDVDFNVMWKVKSAPDFVFNVRDPGGTTKDVAESVMREVIGRSRIDLIQTQERDQTQDAVKVLLQETLDSYGAGIEIEQVQLQKVDPPEQVIEAFRDVQAARADKERSINEAQAYRNQVVPQARGNSARILQEAEAYKQQTIAEAQGEAQRFLSIYEEYSLAKDVTRRRMFLETMEKVLGRTEKIIIDDKAGSGVIPYLALPELGSSSGSARSRAQGENQ